MPTLTAGNAQITVSWTAPTNGGSNITGYKVQWKDGLTAWVDAHSATLNVNLGTSYTIKSLTNGTEYEVQVRATNAKGDGAWSDTASATPADTAPDFGSELVENQK